MTPTVETTLLIAAISMTGIFVFMAIFYLVIVGLDKLLPFEEEKPAEQMIASFDDDEEDEQ